MSSCSSSASNTGMKRTVSVNCKRDGIGWGGNEGLSVKTPCIPLTITKDLFLYESRILRTSRKVYLTGKDLSLFFDLSKFPQKT